MYTSIYQSSTFFMSVSFPLSGDGSSLLQSPPPSEPSEDAVYHNHNNKWMHKLLKMCRQYDIHYRVRISMIKVRKVKVRVRVSIKFRISIEIRVSEGSSDPPTPQSSLKHSSNVFRIHHS
jgi:hypothetical protein